MPKMTRDRFIAVTDDLWQMTQDRFATTGGIFPTLIALNASGRTHHFIQTDSQDPRLSNDDTTVIPGEWTEHLPVLTETFRNLKAVAAILYAEAWIASDDVAVETMAMDIHVHDHPMKDEALIAVGLWPREFVTHGHLARVNRDEHGKYIGISRHERLADAAWLLAPWLSPLLPAVH
jgi:hypothetical protein